MKRTISTAILLMTILSMFLLAACGNKNVDLSDSKYVGTWEVTTVSIKDLSDELGDSWTLILNGDGSGQSVTDEGTNNFTWELTDGGFKTKGDLKLKFTDDGDKIKTKVIGADLIFEKQ